MNWQLFGLTLIPVVGVVIGRAISFLINRLDQGKSVKSFTPAMYAPFDAHKSDSREIKEKIIDEVKRHLAL
jgi:hypothetical protein